MTIQYVGRGVEKTVHANNIQSAKGQTEWDLDLNWFKWKKPGMLINLLILVKEKAHNATLRFSITNTDTKDQLLAKAAEVLK